MVQSVVFQPQLCGSARTLATSAHAAIPLGRSISSDAGQSMRQYSPLSSLQEMAIVGEENVIEN